MRYRVACVYFALPRDLSSFAEACLRFSPEITVRTERAVFVEIGKCRSLYSEATFLQRLRVLLRRYGDSWEREARVAIAADATRALVAAKYGGGGGRGAGISSTEIREADVLSLPLESFEDFADPFGLVPEKNRKPLAAMIHSLQLLGLRTVGDFLRLPVAELASRFGAIALHVRSQLEDSRHVTWPTWAPRGIIEETVELAQDDYCNGLEPLLFHIKSALDRLYARLQGRGLRCASLRLGLQLEKYSTVQRPRRPFDLDFMMPQGTTRGTIPIVQERLEREFARAPLEASVLRVQLLARETTPGYQRQQHLFDRRDDIEEAYHSIIAHLAESVGPERVFRAVVQESRFPEKSWKKRGKENPCSAGKAADNTTGTTGKVSTIPTLARQLALRPARLLTRPRRIEVTREQIFLKSPGRAKTYTIRQWSRVERISADWIESPTFEAIARNYYQVEITEGPPLWIFEDEKHEYYLHGWYE